MAHIMFKNNFNTGEEVFTYYHTAAPSKKIIGVPGVNNYPHGTHFISGQDCFTITTKVNTDTATFKKLNSLPAAVGEYLGGGKVRYLLDEWEAFNGAQNTAIALGVTKDKTGIPSIIQSLLKRRKYAEI